MAAISSPMPVLGTVVLLLAVLVAACVGFGFVPVLLTIALAVTAIMLCAIFVVASSRDGH